MGKQKKSKISKIKRSNQTKTKLSKQGKLKMRRHKKPKKQTQKSTPVPKTIVEEESDQGEDLMDMVEEEDLDFLQKAISSKSYNLLKKIKLNEIDGDQNHKGKKREHAKLLEEKYEEGISKMIEENAGTKIRLLLPVKTQDGHLQKRLLREEEKENDQQHHLINSEKNQEIDEQGNSDMEMEPEIHINLEKQNGKPLSTIELLACREEILRSKRFKIGILSSGLLENPENKSGNLKVLLDLMEERNPEVYITTRKLATVSLLEVFKDLLPSYHILQVNQEGVKLKKDTLQLQNYEAVLLRSYKHYLQKLEKMANLLRRKRGDTRKINIQLIQLGELAVNCMCELLNVHPYFNFSVNIANFLVPLLDNKRVTVREKVANSISSIFKEDKRGELSLTIVRRLNQYVKLKSHCVHTEVISVLLSLRIKDINLDKEKEEETKQKKLISHKQRILALSKRERKRNKKLEQVEKELLETKAEENKLTKQKVLTEITSVVFTIFFRILKQAPNSKVLSVCLEGLAKFAHCINLDFYQDLVSVIDKLMEEGNLGLREQLHCVQCVFTILSGQGLALAIDPYRFYAHLYQNLLNVHCGKTHVESEIVIKTLVQVLINRRKRITQPRLIAFVKRIATLTLQSQHNAALGILGIIKQIMQLGKAANILLDTDCSTGDGFYQPELEEPEYCNAHCTALWELVALQRHYHSTVQRIAKNIAWGVPTSGEGSLTTDIAKLSSEELYTEFDPTGVVFKPAVPIPKKVNIKKVPVSNTYFTNTIFEKYLNDVNGKELLTDEYTDFYKACRESFIK